MGQRHYPTGDGLTVDQVARRLEVDELSCIARVAFEYAGDRAVRQHGHTTTVLGALRLASRRSAGDVLECEDVALECDRLESVFGVNPDRVLAAEELLARQLSDPADPEEIRSLRRRLIVARELLAAVERGSVVGPTLPGSALADAAPFLLARATVGDDSAASEHSIGESGLRTHVERLEADLEFARLGTTLDSLVDENG